MASENIVPEGMVPGSQHVAAVASVDGRFYAQVDNSLVAVLPYPIPQVQVTFLSIRVRYKTQMMQILSVNPSGLMEGTPPQYRGESEATDVGSVRMRPEDALGLGAALVANARDLVSPEDFSRIVSEAGLKLV